MKLTRTAVVLASAGLLGAGGIWLGCGGDDTTTVPGTDAGNDVTSNPDTGNPDTGKPDTGTDAGTPDTGTDAGFAFDGSAPLSCASYCANVIGVCTGNTLGQYLDMPTCLAMCSKFPVGDAGALTGNSLGCRSYHVSVASQSPALAATHCPHAGPYGFGQCGSENENFCTLYNAQCGAADYGGNCPNQSSFGGLNSVDGGSFIAITTGNTQDCREYHLEAAYQGDAGAGVGHCLHASKASAAGTCQ